MKRSTAPIDAAALLGALQPKLAAVGITRLADVTGLDRVGLPVVLAVRPLGRSLAVSQGKGLTREQAAVSAILEAMELHHAERHRLPLRYGRDDELAARLRLVDLEQLPYRQGADRARRRPLLWVEGIDLADGGGRWLPYELVHADYSLPQPAASGLFAQSTSGLAAGATRSGAIRHALLEAVERDALALAAVDVEPPAVRLLDLDGVGDADCRAVLAAVAAAGLAVVALDVTSDLAVATISCRLVERQRVAAAMAHPAEGSAADPLPERALLKALIEAAQARLAFIAGTRDDLDPLDYVALDAERERDFWLACADADWPRRPVATLPRGPADDDEATLGWVCARLASAGLDQVVVVDLDDPDVAVPVVRVVVPGLEPPPHPTHAPGRRALARRAPP
jgi:YcaO-like protein with predicted kinase domain